MKNKMEVSNWESVRNRSNSRLNKITIQEKRKFQKKENQEIVSTNEGNDYSEELLQNFNRDQLVYDVIMPRIFDLICTNELAGLINCFSTTEIIIIALKYNLIGMREYSDEEIMKLLNVSNEKIENVCSRALALYSNELRKTKRRK